MPIKLTRVRAGRWYAGGTVKVGERSEIVREHSTGFAEPEKAAAEDYCRAETVRIQQRLVHGEPARDRRISWETAVARYQGVVSYVTEPRILKFTRQFGGKFLDEITADEWGAFERAHLAGLKRPTINDYRGLMRKVLTDAGHTLPPDLAKALARRKVPPRPPAWLPADEADALVSCYAPHARPVAVLARRQGMRAGELARLEFRDLDFDRRNDAGEKVGAIFIRETKNTRPRTVPMHPQTRGVLLDLYRHRQIGNVFLTPSGAPYADTRNRGGNPFKRTHNGAVRRVTAVRKSIGVIGVMGPEINPPNNPPNNPPGKFNGRNSAPPLFPALAGFRFHDWRHHFATEAIRSGMDLVSLKEVGGWESLEALEKYVHADFSHISEQLRRMV